MLILLALVGLGVFLLIAALAFLAGKLASKNYYDQEQEGIIQDDCEEYHEDIDSIDNEGAIFIIDESIMLDSPCLNNRSSVNNPSEQSDKNESAPLRYGSRLCGSLRQLKMLF